MQSEGEDEEPEAPPVKSPNLSPQKATHDPAVNPAAPARPSPNPIIFEPTLPAPSSSSLSNQHVQGQRASPVAQRAPPAPSPKPSPSPSPSPRPSPSHAASGGGGGMVGMLEERLNMYKSASANAKTAGDSSKQRRLDRGIKVMV